MPVIYEVTITPSAKENDYTITWYNPDTNAIDSFDSRAAITPEEAEGLWHKLPHQLPIGQKLFRFLDGDARHLVRALDHAINRVNRCKFICVLVGIPLIGLLNCWQKTPPF